MRGPIAISIAAHLLVLTGTHFLGHRFEMVSSQSIMDVSLVSSPAPAVARPAAARPAAPKPATAEKVLPEVAVKPGQKRDLDKRVADKEKQASRKPAKKPETPPEETPESTATGDTGVAPAGATLGEVRLDTANFQFAYYLSALRNKIASHWSPGALPPGSEGRMVTVYFRISRDGSLHEVAVETASGNGFFDQSALRAIYASSPVGPLPFGFAEGSLGVHFDFRQAP
jgi:TonB family protein